MKLTVENFESNFRQKKKTERVDRLGYFKKKEKSTVDSMMLLEFLL